MWKFSELPYERPNCGAVRRSLNAKLKRFESAPDYAAQRAALIDLSRSTYDFFTPATLAQIRSDINTKDPFYEKERKFWDSYLPKLLPFQKKMMDALIHARFRKELEAEFGTISFQQAEAQIRLADPKLIPNMVQDSLLGSRYSKLTAGCKVEFQGESCNFYGLLKHMEDPDRSVRAAAFVEWAKLYEGVSGELDEIYDKLVKLRTDSAHKLGMQDYVEMAYLNRGRYDYGPAEVKRFREAVVQYIVPLCAKLYEEQRVRIGADKLHWYDESFFYSDGNAVPIGSKDELVAKAQQMYRELSPETGEFFDYMCEHELFDLETRDGKHMGGYCTDLFNVQSPFIFSNFNGTSADVDVLTHEAGHAFQAYLAMRTILLPDQMQAPIEICEVHSMSMEHFTYPWMELFFGDKADKYRYAHLASALRSIPYLCAVDDFQHRVYAKPDMSREERYAAWHAVEELYLPWRDYDGNAFLEKGGFWMQKQHIFLYPFYYIDYALAQMGAFNFYLKMLTDREAAFSDYLKLCRAGGTVGYKALLAVGGLDDPFKEGTVEKIGKAVEQQLHSMADALAAKA